jgi:hypothetical protein
LQKKPKATKRSNHRKISPIAQTENNLARIVRRGIERKIEDVLGDSQFGLRGGKVTRDAIGMLRRISERTVYTDEEFCARVIDWQKPFDRVKWTKLMQILNGPVIDWGERRLFSKLYID